MKTPTAGKVSGWMRLARKGELETKASETWINASRRIQEAFGPRVKKSPKRVNLPDRRSTIATIRAGEYPLDAYIKPLIGRAIGADKKNADMLTLFVWGRLPLETLKAKGIECLKSVVRIRVGVLTRARNGSAQKEERATAKPPVAKKLINPTALSAMPFIGVWRKLGLTGLREEYRKNLGNPKALAQLERLIVAVRPNTDSKKAVESLRNGLK